MTVDSPSALSARLDGRGGARHWRLPVAALGLDAAIMGVAVLLGVLGRRHLEVFATPSAESNVSIVGPLLILGWLGLHQITGAYRLDVFGAGTDEFRRLVTSAAIAAGLLGVMCYLVKYQLSRGFFVLTFLIGIPALLLGRMVLRKLLHAARRRGAFRQRMLLVGGCDHIDEIAAVLTREPWLGYEIVGGLTPHPAEEPETATGIPLLGTVHETRSIVDRLDADILFFTDGSALSATELRELMWDLEHHDLQVVVAPRVHEVASDRIRVRPVAGLPMMHLEGSRWAHASRWAKRSFDLLFSSLIIVLASPVLVFAALRIKLYDGGPILFKQVRVGRGGEEFHCLKFRTMVVDAESLVIKLQEELGTDALLFKMKDDPRITKPGKWLRRFSIDELPQLFNVVRGDMSLVGPRPQVPREVALYNDSMSRRLNVRPGMTGLWQVSGRNELSVEDAMRLDLYYVDNWSMLQDISILSRTLSAVLSSRGAY